MGVGFYFSASKVSNKIFTEKLLDDIYMKGKMRSKSASDLSYIKD